MLIVHISDLHIMETLTSHQNSIIEKMNDSVLELAEDNEEILLCICGDLVDKGQPEFYKDASVLLEKIKEQLGKKHKVYFGFCPGNHDFCKKNDEGFQPYYEFVRQYLDVKSLEGEIDEPAYVLVLKDADFIFINSSYKGVLSRGEIDYCFLEKILKERADKKKVLVLHHTIISMDDDDKSSILNAAKFLKLLNKYNVALVLHGHTHGVDEVPVGKGTHIVGVGALFSRDNVDVNSQFNVIRYINGSIITMRNYTYHKDQEIFDKPQKCLEIPIWNQTYNNYFTGNNIKEIYHNLQEELKHSSILYNVVLYGTFKLNEFEKDVNALLDETQDFDFSYRELAAKWQASNRPNELHFNHGEYFQDKNKKDGVQYIADTLREKPTSNKAILVTVDTDEIMQGETKGFLPSLISVQFGIDENNPEKLYVTVSLRALEASRFLKINIGESLYLIKKIKSALNWPIKEIEFTLHAFRTQLKNSFSCFVKADIDQDQDRVFSLGVQKKCNELINLLENKKKYNDTVIVEDGIRTIYDSFIKANKFYDDVNYGSEVLNSAKELLDAYEELKKVHSKSSVATESEEKEAVAKEKLNTLINVLKAEMETE